MDRLLLVIIYILVALARLARPLAGLGIGRYSEYKEGDVPRILLVGYNGARNTGSDARVVSIAQQLRKLYGGRVRLTVLTLSAESLKGYFDEDVELLEISSLFPIPLFRACLEHHAAVLCEGSTLKSTFANALTLFQCEAAALMAAQGKLCIAYGAEIGHMDPWLERAAKRLCRDTYFITRTKGSYERLRALGLKGHCGTDAAWDFDGALSKEQAEELLIKRGWDGSSPLLGIALIDPFCWPVKASFRRWAAGGFRRNIPGQYDRWYFFSDSKDRRDRFEAYVSAATDAARSFLQRHGFFPVILGMERLDSKACRSLEEKLGMPAAVFMSSQDDAGVMTGVLRKLDMLVTSRYHAAVLSMEGGAPVVAVSMDERLDGIITESGLDGGMLLGCSDPMLRDKLERAMERAAEIKDETGLIMREALEGYKKKLEEMETFLVGYLERGMSAGPEAVNT